MLVHTYKSFLDELNLKKKIKESCKEQSKLGERNKIYFQLIS